MIGLLVFFVWIGIGLGIGIFTMRYWYSKDPVMFGYGKGEGLLFMVLDLGIIVFCWPLLIFLAIVCVPLYLISKHIIVSRG